MTLMMTETGDVSVSSFELHDDCRFIRGATLSLLLVHHIPTTSTEDSEPVNDNTDNPDPVPISNLAVTR